MLSDSNFLEFLDAHYRLGSCVSLRWLPSPAEESIGFFETYQGRYVLRCYAGTVFPKARFVAQFLLFLQEHGVEAERIIQSHSGQPICELPSGEALIVFQFHAGSPLPTECQNDYRMWGRYVGRLHRIGQQLQAQGEWTATLVSRPVGRWLEDAWACVPKESEEAQILLGCEMHIQQEQCEPCGFCSAVHGDLWPGNLLVDKGNPRAIDFSEGGLGPLALDLATTFRWLTWERPDIGRQRWDWWLQGYEEEWQGPLPAESTVVSWAMLQQVRYLVEEVKDCLGGRDGPEVKPSDYVRDHAAKLKWLLSVAAR